MSPYTYALVGAALLVLASPTNGQGVAGISKDDGMLKFNAPDVQFKLAGGSDTVVGIVGELDQAEVAYKEALDTFKKDTSAMVAGIIKANTDALASLETSAKATMATTDSALSTGMSAKNNALQSKKSSFETKVDALKASITAKLAEYEALAGTVPGKIAEITSALNAEKTKATDNTDSFKNGINSQVKQVTDSLSDKKTTKKYIWVGGSTGSAGGGWGYLPLNRVDLAAQANYFSVSGSTFTVRIAGLYRLNYRGIQRGGNCNGYSLLRLNGRSISAYHYNKHIGGGNTYNPQQVDVTWYYTAGQRVQLYIYDCRTRWYGTGQGSLQSYNSMTFSYEGANKAEMLARP